MAVHTRFISQGGFQKFGVLFLFLYVATTGMMFIFLYQDKRANIIAQYDDSQYVDSHSMFYPKKPLADEPTPSNTCFFNMDTIKTPTFQTLDPATFILSGYYDSRDPTNIFIRLLVLAEALSNFEPVYCLFRSTYNNSLGVIKATFDIIDQPTDSLKYGTYMMSCAIKDYRLLSENPCKVYISHQVTIEAFHLTVPLLSLEKSVSRYAFGVCVPPIHGVVPQHRLVEFVEFQKVLGADHVFLYPYQGDVINTYANPNLQQVIEYYKTSQTVQVYPWKLPTPNAEVNNLASLLAVQHCLYSNMWNYDYLIFLHFDEFLVPHSSNSWAEMTKPYVGEVDELIVDKGICFKTVLFPPDVTEPLVSMASLRRTIETETDTRCLVRPEQLLTFHPYKQSDRRKSDHVKPPGAGQVLGPEVGLVHVYRDCDNSNRAKCDSLKTDEVILKYHKFVTDEFKSAMHKIAKIKIPMLP